MYYRRDILNHSCYFLFVIHWNYIIIEDINTLNDTKIIKFLSKLNCKKKYLFSNTINKEIIKILLYWNRI